MTNSDRGKMKYQISSGGTMRRLFFLFCLSLPLFLAGCEPHTGAGDLSTAAAAAISPRALPTPATPTGTSASECFNFSASRDEARVTRVVDGDSIEADINGVPFDVRYIGMDAPEMDTDAFAEDARAANLKLVGGKIVVLIRDQAEADRFGRLLRYVLADGIFVNRELVRLGLARAGSYPPNTTCDSELQAAQTEALLAKRGLWALLGSATAGAGTLTGTGCPNGCVTPPAGCVIKGNINAEGVKIYHLPGQKYYEDTVIEPAKGERWFCSEAEAVAAGWRKSRV
jgi:micrococcal nuclease